jgi:hypothetical protein
MNTTDQRRTNLGFLILALIGAACGGSLAPSPDAAVDVPPNVCANAGCAAPPLCSVGCTATCGCCSCSPGQRSGELVCTDQGCFAPAPAIDGGGDGGADGAGGVCALPFEVGPCDAAVPVFASVDGVCVPRIYGGCQGNGNRFWTLEECQAACEGRPVPNGCVGGRVAHEICVSCGPAGGCGKTQTVCALPCGADAAAGAAACGASSLQCYGGFCQVGFCI